MERIAISRKTDSETTLFFADKAYFNHKIVVFKRLMRIFVADITFPFIKMSIRG